MANFKGIFPALLTPFAEDGSVNNKALEALIEMNIEKGVDGFYVGGSTAEAFMLTEEERHQLYRTVKDIVGDRKTLIAHVGAVSTDLAESFAHTAEKAGYDAISAVAPFYYKFSVDEIKQYYFDIAGSVDLPMLVYNIPAFSGVQMTAELLGEFLSDDRFLGVKHTSNDMMLLNNCKRLFPDKVIYNGYDEIILAGLSMGADGGIGSTYNFMAEKFVRLYKDFNAGNYDAAKKQMDEIVFIIGALIKAGVMQGEKALLCEMGIDFGGCRKPFAPLPEDKRRELIDTVMPLL